jgi:2-keto-4-pentenoate hydratase/2-oxohepta-3-ene-1,7-dioic acid hydratase in catechol pathway
MKLLRYGPSGAEKPGLMHEDGTIRDLSAHVDDIAGEVLTDAGLARLRALDPGALPVVEGNPRIGPCVGRVGKFLCIGLNYSDHAAETGAPIPEEPILFFKATSAIIGPDDDVIIPKGSEKTDWEVELGVVIGSQARYLEDEAAAMSAIAGYCVSNDVSERAFQLERGGQWVKGKSCETFNPLGPWLVTPDEVGDLDSLGMWLDVNGERVQDGTTKNMVFDVPHLVWYLSQFMVLEPGDLINTGTPAGVGLGFDPPRYLQEGDVMELSIEGLGKQRQTCRRATR